MLFFFLGVLSYSYRKLSGIGAKPLTAFLFRVAMPCEGAESVAGAAQKIRKQEAEDRTIIVGAAAWASSSSWFFGLHATCIVPLIMRFASFTEGYY